jgi:hypothetical protein
MGGRRAQTASTVGEQSNCINYICHNGGGDKQRTLTGTKVHQPGGRIAGLSRRPKQPTGSVALVLPDASVVVSLVRFNSCKEVSRSLRWFRDSESVEFSNIGMTEKAEDDIFRATS